jgi:hypothetical protein
MRFAKPLFIALFALSVVGCASTGDVRHNGGGGAQSAGY